MSFFAPRAPVYLLGPSAWLPERVMTNEAVIAWMGATIRPSWIEHRTGIRERRWVEDGMACSDLAERAARRLLERFPAERARVRQLVLATISGDYPTPPTSPLVQHLLGLADVGAFDLGAACAGFTTGLHATASLVLGTGEVHLLVAADIRSRFLAQRDLATTALFGDGAAAVLVSPDAAGASFRFVASQLIADGAHADLISIAAGGSRLPYPQATDPGDAYLKMKQGAVLFLKAAEGMAWAAGRFLERLGLGVADVDWVVPHQANLHLLREVGKRLGVAPEKMVETVQVTGNTSGASVGIALASLEASQRARPGQKVLLVAAGGGGLTACALLEAC